MFSSSFIFVNLLIFFIYFFNKKTPPPNSQGAYVQFKGVCDAHDRHYLPMLLMVSKYDALSFFLFLLLFVDYLFICLFVFSLHQIKTTGALVLIAPHILFRLWYYLGENHDYLIVFMFLSPVLIFFIHSSFFFSSPLPAGKKFDEKYKQSLWMFVLGLLPCIAWLLFFTIELSQCQNCAVAECRNPCNPELFHFAMTAVIMIWIMPLFL